jgi:hypothetical protein
LHRHSVSKDKPEVQAEVREDFAAVLISTLRVELKKICDDGRSLVYQTPLNWRQRMSARTIGQHKIDRSDIGLTYVVNCKDGFNHARAIKNGELLLDHSLNLIKKVFEAYPKSQEMPMQLDYGVGIICRNMLIWALFRYIKPEEI